MTFNLADYAIPTIYSYYYPQTKKMVDNLNSAYLHSDYEEVWNKQNLSGNSMLPDYVNSFFSAYEAATGIINKNNYYTKYVTAGSSEAIRESFAEYKVKMGDKARVHMFLGEYEGFYKYAKCFDIDVIFHNRNTYADSLRMIFNHEIFILTNPSSIDGNEWPEFNNFISFICQNHPGILLYLDLTYLGVSTKPLSFMKDLMNNCVLDKVFFSMSKAFGMYYHRLGGVYSRNQVWSLEANRYFNNKFSIRLGTELLNKYKIDVLPNTLKDYQIRVVDIIKEGLSDSSITASDSVIMATGDKVTGFTNSRIKFNRVDIARYCLTPGINKLYLEDQHK